MIKPNDRGDTIIEVLISLAVLGLVIGSAYGITNRSLKGMRMAQERSEALKIAEGQVEQLKANPSLLDGHKCINTVSPGICVFGFFTVDISKSIDNNNIFIVAVTWEKIGGGNENLELRYGVY